MIRYLTGDIFESGAEALVNPVNSKGVMGKGLAAEFKRRFPSNFLAYQIRCHVKSPRFKPGDVFTSWDNKRLIINAATKGDWRRPSKLEWVELTLLGTCAAVLGDNIKSIAIPALGCGLGGLDWAHVKPLFERHLSDINCDVMVYEPQEQEKR